MDPVTLHHGLIEALVSASGLTHDQMHVHAGLAIYIGAQWLLRTRRASALALQMVLAAEILNEGAEALYYSDMRWSDTLWDVVLTMFWPVVLTATGMYRRRRWQVEQDIRRLGLSQIRATFSRVSDAEAQRSARAVRTER